MIHCGLRLQHFWVYRVLQSPESYSLLWQQATTFLNELGCQIDCLRRLRVAWLITHFLLSPESRSLLWQQATTFLNELGCQIDCLRRSRVAWLITHFCCLLKATVCCGSRPQHFWNRSNMLVMMWGLFEGFCELGCQIDCLHIFFCGLLKATVCCGSRPQHCGSRPQHFWGSCTCIAPHNRPNRACVEIGLTGACVEWPWTWVCVEVGPVLNDLELGPVLNDLELGPVMKWGLCCGYTNYC